MKKFPQRYSSECQLAQSIISSRGLSPTSDLSAINELDRYGIDVLIPFLLEKCDFDRVFIAIDNIDDCIEDVKDMAFAFAQNITDIGMKCDPDISSPMCVVVALRDYTHIPTDTEDYHIVDLPRLSTGDIMRAKIINVKDLIDRNYEGIAKRGLVTSTDFVERESSTKNGTIIKYYQRHISGKWLTINNISTVLLKLIEKSEVKQKDGLLDFIDNISAGNLMLVTSNTYLFCHSCKLDFTNIIPFVYVSEDDPTYSDVLASMESESYGPPIIYDILMAIHYPFYDTKTSKIPNLFNVRDSTAPNDFKNTLGLIRLLCYLRNNKGVVLSSLIKAMESIGYKQNYIFNCVEKALNYCLLNTSFGTKLGHLNDNTIMKLSSSGIYLLNNTICNHRYLCYACEDTPMEPEYIVPIENKYTKGESGSLLRERMQAASFFYSFLKKEEEKELDFVVKEKGWSRNSFLHDFSLDWDGIPITIAEYIRRHILSSTNINIQS